MESQNTVSAYFAYKQIRYCLLALQDIAKLYWLGDLHRDVCGVQCFVLFCWQEHFVDVMRNQEFVLLPMDEVSKLLCSDDLNVPSEETIFHALVMWAKHEAISRRKHLARLLAHIKLPLLQPQVSHTRSSSHHKARLRSRALRWEDGHTRNPTVSCYCTGLKNYNFLWLYKTTSVKWLNWILDAIFENGCRAVEAIEARLVWPKGLF